MMGMLKKTPNACGNYFIHYHMICESPQLTPFVSYLMAYKASCGHFSSVMFYWFSTLLTPIRHSLVFPV